MSMSSEFEQSSQAEGETIVARDFDEFLISINNLGPTAVSVKIFRPVVDETEGIIGMTEFSFYTPGDRKDVYREKTRRGRESRTARTRMRLIMSMFPQVKVRPMEQSPVGQRSA